MKTKHSKGFTLLEILLVIAIIAILAGIVIIAINPGKQLAEARNAQRRVDVNTILNAIYQYAVDHNGTLPSGITTSAQTICATTDATTTCTTAGLTTINEVAWDQKYITGIPADPSCSGTGTTSACYEIFKSANGRVTVRAFHAENGASIGVTR